MSTTHSSRRTFIKASGLSLMALTLPDTFNFEKLMQNKNGYMMYVGTYTNGKSEGIYLYKLDPQTGALTHVNTTKGIKNPSFLAIDPKRNFLFAVSEVGDFEGKPGGAISSFAINQKTGALTLLNQQPTQGGAPCYVTVDKTGKSVLAANYSGGNVSIFSVGADGKLSTPTVFQHEGSGPDKKRQDKPHAHCIVLDPANKFAFSADLGTDKIVGYRFDAKQSKLIAGQPAAVSVKPGAGPRHFVFHPNGRFAFVINELDNTITAFSYTTSTGALKELQTISTLPQGYNEESYCADIHVSADGKFVYGSNRGHNSIAVFAVDAQSGKLTFVEHVSTGGKWPRNFTLDPTGKLLLVANQNTDNVVAFRIDTNTGKLTATGQVLDVPAPVCLKIVPAFG